MITQSVLPHFQPVSSSHFAVLVMISFSFRYHLNDLTPMMSISSPSFCSPRFSIMFVMIFAAVIVFPATSNLSLSPLCTLLIPQSWLMKQGNHFAAINGLELREQLLIRFFPLSFMLCSPHLHHRYLLSLRQIESCSPCRRLRPAEDRHSDA